VADVDHFTYGLFNPLFALGTSALACLLGLILATQALGHVGRARFRLLVYASLALGGGGLWVADVAALLGFSVPDSELRYASAPLAASFGVAVVGVGAGLAVICTGRMRLVRLLVGGFLVAAAMNGTHMLALTSVRIGGTLSVEPDTFLWSAAAAIVTSGLVVWMLVALRHLWVALMSALLLASAITATHYLTMTGVRVRLGVEHAPIQGISPILLSTSMLLFSTTVLAILWFFAAGTATRRDLEAIFAAPHRPIDIEPWMIEEVTARIAFGTTPAPDDARVGPLPTRLPPTTAPSWRSLPAQNSVAMAVNGRTGLSIHGNARSVGWVANRPVPAEPSTTVDDTEVHGLGAALVNSAQLVAALGAAGTGVGNGVAENSAADRSPAKSTTVDSAVAAAGVAVLTDPVPADAVPAESAPADPASEEEPPLPKRSRWRNRRR
jgi:NO-binding membrane sensor protein with MHYT domain